jgi:hypothetical protein
MPDGGEAMLRCLLVVAFAMSGCTQEWQNKISRSIQNYTGTDGVLDIIGGDKVLYRFIQIDKMTTASATGDSATARAYRFGYGIMDLNQNYKADDGEKKVYFEVSDYSTNYVFYENPSL